MCKQATVCEHIHRINFNMSVLCLQLVAQHQCRRELHRKHTVVQRVYFKLADYLLAASGMRKSYKTHYMRCWSETRSCVTNSTKRPCRLGMVLIVTKKILRGANEKEI